MRYAFPRLNIIKATLLIVHEIDRLLAGMGVFGPVAACRDGPNRPHVFVTV